MNFQALDMTSVIGALAAFGTSAANFPQLKKCWDTGRAGDISLKMLLILATGLALWIAYGVLRADVVIVAANAVSLCLVLGILYFKIRDPG